METLRRKNQLIDQLLLGQVLHKQYIPPINQHLTGEVAYFLTPSHQPVQPAPALAAINSGELRPLGDGLFGPDSSQSWGIK